MPDVGVTVRTQGTSAGREGLIGVLVWRVDTLLDAGYSREQARDLAAELAVDLHVAVELVEAGCPHETATRILL